MGSWEQSPDHTIESRWRSRPAIMTKPENLQPPASQRMVSNNNPYDKKAKIRAELFF
jgi:hypothetical protein